MPKPGAHVCEGEVIVQGDEGPVRGVAQVVDGHGVTVDHQEREEEEEQQEVESDGEENTQGMLRMSMDGMTMKDKCERLEPCGVMNDQTTQLTDSVQVCSILHVAHVYVRRVIHVIVHYGLTDVEGVLVVIHTFT